MNNINLENLLKETQEKIAKFLDTDDVTVQITGYLFEVKSKFCTMFSYNLKDGHIVEGQAHKVGFTPTRLYDFREAVNQFIENKISIELTKGVHYAVRQISNKR